MSKIAKEGGKRYMLIDGHALIHRGFHAVPNLATKSGEPIGAVYGFAMILLKAIKDLKPTHIACCFDLEGKTFRHEKYTEYKAQRVKQPDELYAQIPRVKELVSALNIPIFEKPGFEADDLLGTLSVELTTYNLQLTTPFEIMIVTGDMDTLQLVNEQVKIYTLRKGLGDTAVYDTAAIYERFGLTPLQMIDYKALRGDPSDNIKGVKGIGEKTAVELIKEFGSIENLYKEIRNHKSEISKKIKPRVLQLLIEGEDAARQSYELSKIVTDVEIDPEVPEYIFDSSHLASTVKLFQALEFRTLIDKLPKEYNGKFPISNFQFLNKSEDYETNGKRVSKFELVAANAHSSPPAGGLTPHSSEMGKQDYQLVDTAEKLQELIQKLAGQEEFALDTESTSLNIVDAKLVGVSLAFSEGEAFYVPADIVLQNQEFQNILTSSTHKVGHNLKYDLHILQGTGINVSGVYFDTMLASYLLNASSRQHSLDALAFVEFGYQMQPITDLIGKGKTEITMDQVPVEKVSWYAAEDADMTLRLKNIFQSRLATENLEKIFFGIEMPLVPVLVSMERFGIKMDSKILKNLSSMAAEEIAILENEIHVLTDSDFNINSPKQLKEVLFDKLKLPTAGNKKTKTGISTAAGELEKMLGLHPVIPKILEYRELTKLQSTYLESLPKLVNSKTGRIHTSYNQTIAATGRLSSTDPNLQNIPVGEDGLGSKVRQAFVAEKGFKLVSLDYSQMELRIVAHLSGDEAMSAVFLAGGDIHTKTATGLFGVSEESVTKEMRRHAKTVNFGILYGLSAFGLSSRIAEIESTDAKSYIEKYFATYPGVWEYLESVKLEVREKAEVRNQLGRLRKFPEIKSSQFFIRQAAERAAINFPIQSLQADIIKIAMIDIWSKIKDKGLEVRLLLQVHDELVFEIQEDKVEHYINLIRPLMENALKLNVPVVVDAKVGDNWGEMENFS